MKFKAKFIYLFNKVKLSLINININIYTHIYSISESSKVPDNNRRYWNAIANPELGLLGLSQSHKMKVGIA